MSPKGQMQADRQDRDNVVELRAAAQKKLGTPNPVWDACVEVLGYEPKTRSEKALWGKMTTSLREAEATAERIKLVAEWYKKQWPDIDLTITAIEKWYSHFLKMAEDRKRRGGSTCPDCGLGGNRHTVECSHAKRS